MLIYNTLTKTKEDFSPARGKRVNLFVCGPTVYGASHIGHARTYVFFDVMVNYLRSQGIDLFYLQNITDIDDKIIHRAKELGKDPLKLAREETENYKADMASIKVGAVSEYAPASDVLPEIISQIERLIEKGNAYEANGSVYFDISTFSDFGKLSHQKLSALQKAARTEEDPNKKNAHDFVLWRGRAKDSGPLRHSFSEAREPVWDSPWGPGRPGWHIEDTAITEKYFGPQYDIHGGGIELLFPHHEAEIAQMESISGVRPLSKIWMHVGWVTVKGEKMSKSLGNFIPIGDIVKKYSPEALRLFILQTQYRSPVEYSDEAIRAAHGAVRGIAEMRAKLRVIERKNKEGEKMNIEEIKHSIEKSLDDDFNSALAISNFFAFLNIVEKHFAEQTLSSAMARVALKLFDFIENIFGIIPPEAAIPEEIRRKAAEREKLRENKEWKAADAIRNELLRGGYELSDTPEGTIILPH